LANYIDLHSHILPGIDDGPISMNEAVMLAREYVRSGYDTVVATSHSGEGKPEPALLLERLSELQAELERQNIALKLLPGAEEHINPGVLQNLKEGKTLTLNRTCYLLLELPMLQPLPPYSEQLIFELCAHGYRPVIPHPERTAAFHTDRELVHHLHKAGAIFQLTWGALTGWLGSPARKLALYMVEANLAHLFATDAHGAASRLLTIDKASACLEEYLGPGLAELMLLNRPRLLLADQKLDLPAAVEEGSRPQSKTSFISRFKQR